MNFLTDSVSTIAHVDSIMRFILPAHQRFYRESQEAFSGYHLLYCSNWFIHIVLSNSLDLKVWSSSRTKTLFTVVEIRFQFRALLTIHWDRIQ